ncbi:MAG TPA: hypothetical protein VMR74_15785 [Gammaproteobacteria bacterium]|nr:hypothetical protein [Gammaproteobacteria bacterium]
MSEWFSPEVGPWFSWLSLMSLVAITSIWIERGQHKKLVTGIYIISVAVGGLFLVAGMVARVVDQPSYVVRPLLMSGFVITAVFAATWPVVLDGYRKAEQRKILARDM